MYLQIKQEIELEEEKRKISFSQLDKFLSCQRAWYYSYYKKLWSPPSTALKLGSAWHNAIEYYYNYIIEQSAPPKFDAVQEFFNGTFKKIFQPGKVQYRENETYESVRKLGIRLLRLHYDALSSTVKPHLVEYRFKLELDSAILVGVIDLITEDGTIKDNKAQSKAPSQRVIDNHREGVGLQLSTYALAYRYLFGQNERGLGLDISEKKPNVKGALKFVQRNTRRSEKQLWYVEKLINNTAIDIDTAIEASRGMEFEAEAFKQNPSYRWCDSRYCQHWRYCMGVPDDNIIF